MSKYNPKNFMEALTYQLEEDVRVLRCLALQGEVKDFKKGLKTMDAHIKGTMKWNKAEDTRISVRKDRPYIQERPHNLDRDAPDRGIHFGRRTTR